MPRAAATVPKTRRSAPTTERKRTPVRRKPVVAQSVVAQFDSAAHQEEIAHAAYLNWLARDGQNANPEEDWFLAEHAVRARYTA